VFVTGEAGIGKSALVTAFLQQIAGDIDIWVARGQCIEHYGAGEAYLPVLEALSRLGREAGGQRLVRFLRQYAPTWLVHLPMLLSASGRAKVRSTATGVTQGRMLRELAEAVEMLTSQVGLVLWFEDVQWSDPSTLEWVGYMARRPGFARLLVVSTCRPVAMLEHEHPLPPLTQELFLHGQAVELRLGGITAGVVVDYLSWRLGHGRGSAALQTLAWAMHQRTEGNPLFILHVVEHLLAQGLRVPSDGQVALQDALTLVQRCVPQQIQQLIENQLARLSPEEERLLAIASVAGAEFSAASVAAGLEIGVEEVEERCAGLAQRALFIQARGTTDWPDGTVATRYAFLHALYVHVLYERIPPGHRQAMHGRLAQRLEQAYGVHVRTVAAELALHFERGRHYDKAIHYLHQAGENASRLSAHTEAVRLLTNGLALLQTLPETPECLQQELSLQFALGPSLIVLKGYAAPEVEHLFTRTYALCHKVSDTRHLFAALVGLSGMYHNRAEYQRVRDLVGQMLCLAQETASSTRQLWAHVLMAQVLYQTGVFGRARMHYRQAMALYESRRHSPTVSDITQDPRVHCLANLAEVLWLRGYPDQALQHSQEAYTIAQRLAHPSSQVVALASATLVHSWRGEHRVASELAEALIALAREHGFPHWLAVGTIRHGVAAVAQASLRQAWRRYARA
jgi:tetratricopeptide (TPR) repeat protein